MIVFTRTNYYCLDLYQLNGFCQSLLGEGEEIRRFPIGKRCIALATLGMFPASTLEFRGRLGQPAHTSGSIRTADFGRTLSSRACLETVEGEP